MSAADQLGRQFFHGTSQQFQPGDLIEPGHDSPFGDTPRKRVYVADSHSLASFYARFAARQSGVPSRAAVYRVEPLGILYDDSGSGGRGAYSTDKPLRVIKEVSVRPVRDD
jgi:hypothetical protein